MKTNLPRIFAVALAVVTGLWFAGCATPATRIRANPDAFARLTPQQQELVQAGQVALGFDAEAVKLSLGEPDRVAIRTDGDGEKTIWHYVTYEAEGRILLTGHYHTGRRWGGWGPSYAYYLNYPSRRVRDRFSVEFRNGRVSAITESHAN